MRKQSLGSFGSLMRESTYLESPRYPKPMKLVQGMKMKFPHINDLPLWADIAVQSKNHAASETRTRTQ